MISQEMNVNGSRLSYRESIGSYARTVVFLPAGAAWASDLEPVASKFEQSGCKMVVVDYPGRGMSDFVRDGNEWGELIFRTGLLVRKYSDQELMLVGHSFGSAVASEVLDQNPDLDTKKLILVTPGEFFSESQRKWLKLLFSPTEKNLTLARFYWAIIKPRLFAGRKLNDEQLMSLGRQWNATLDYRIDASKTHDFPTTIINVDGDKVIDRNSIKRVKKKFPNFDEVSLMAPHIFDYDSEAMIRVVTPAILSAICE